MKNTSLASHPFSARSSFIAIVRAHVALLSACLAATPSFGASPSVAWTVAATGGPASQSAFSSGRQSMALDADGNVYVTGRKDNGVNSDALTVKHDTNGVTQWRAVVNGANNSTEAGVALVLDASANVFVAGQSSNGTDSDFLVVKYDRNGVEQWRVATDGGAEERATAAAVDASGNLYVTGYSFNSSATWECLTVKYDTAGTERWRARAVCGDESPFSLALGADGDVHVLGRNVRIKYSADGQEKGWIIDPSFHAAAMAVDSQGNLHVTGATGARGEPLSRYVTVKYDASGVERWRIQDEGPASRASAIATDAAGNVYVSGDSNGVYVTIKYDANGAAQWRVSGAKADSTANLAVDAAGNVYLTGVSRGNSPFDYVVIKYDANGTEQWRNEAAAGEAITGAPAIAIDGHGNVFINGSRSDGPLRFHFLSVKYSAAGVGQWLVDEGMTKAGASIGAAARSIAVGPGNDVVVTGTSLNRQMTVLYSAGGAERWRAFEPEFGSAIVATDAQGNVHVAGPGRTGYLIVKYDRNGERQWRQLDSADGAFGTPRGLAVDSSGNIHVTGVTALQYLGDPFAGFRRFVTIKYDANGVQQWRATAHPSDDRWDEGHAIALGADGSVHVTGVLGYGPDSEHLTIKYSAGGVEQWRALSRGAGDGYVSSSDVAVDGLGNVYFTGSSWQPATNTYKALTISYDASGAERWRVVEDAGATSAAAVKLDAAGNVYVLGPNFTVVKYDTLGHEQWRTAGTGGAADGNRAAALAVTDDGVSYVTGGSHNGFDYDYLTIKYGADGIEQWRARRNNLDARDFAMAVAPGSDGSVFVAGDSNIGHGPPAIVIQKLVEQIVPGTVVEYFNPDLDHYFITADPAEQASVDSGAVGRWQRTGTTFAAGGSSAACRFYGNAAANPATGSPYGPNSHFYTANAAECESLIDLYTPAAKSWRLESYDFPATPAANGACEPGLRPVYRAYNNGFARGIDSNHRITTDLNAIGEVVARGWIFEGIAMCLGSE